MVRFAVRHAVAADGQTSGVIPLSSRAEALILHRSSKPRTNAAWGYSELLGIPFIIDIVYAETFRTLKFSVC